MGNWAALIAGVLVAMLAGPGTAVASAVEPADVAPAVGARRDASRRYLNTAGEIPMAGPWVTWPFFLRRAVAMLAGRDGLPAVVANDGAFLRENARHSSPTVTWIGHATLLVQMDHATFLTDPIWSERASPVGFAGPKRLVPPGLPIDLLPPIHFVLISHNHYDHLDVDTLRAIAERNPGARFIAPLGNGDTLRDAGVKDPIELDWGAEAEVAGLRIVCVPAQHWSGRGPFDQRTTLWASYAVLGPTRRFFFTGDSGYFDGFARTGGALGPFDLAAVPIGAYLPSEMMHPWHMNPEEAVQTGRDLRAAELIGMHYGTFDLSDESPAEPPVRFRAAAAAAGFEPAQVLLPRIGETTGF